jgi:hypothetical protein
MNETELLQKLRELDPKIIEQENLSGSHKKKAWNMIVERKKLVNGHDIEKLAKYKSGDIVTFGKWEYKVCYPYRFNPAGVVYKVRKVKFNGKLAKEENLFIQDHHVNESTHDLGKQQQIFKDLVDSHGVTPEQLADALEVHLVAALYSKDPRALNSKKRVLSSLKSVNKSVQGQAFLDVVANIVKISRKGKK